MRTRDSRGSVRHMIMGVAIALAVAPSAAYAAGLNEAAGVQWGTTGSFDIHTSSPTTYYYYFDGEVGRDQPCGGTVRVHVSGDTPLSSVSFSADGTQVTWTIRGTSSQGCSWYPNDGWIFTGTARCSAVPLPSTWTAGSGTHCGGSTATAAWTWDHSPPWTFGPSAWVSLTRTVSAL